MTIVHVVGARPNFVKVAPVLRAIALDGFAEQKLVHTGQHYDRCMSEAFLADLAMPRPDAHLGVGSGTHAQQTAKAMTRFEEYCLAERPDLVVVVGDVNSTLAAALAAAKLHIPCAHVEAGLRSFDNRMPEEINRRLTDHLCDLLFTPSADADENLLREGLPRERIYRAGNVMIDSLYSHLDAARERKVAERLALTPRAFAVLTLHRPSNVDDGAVLVGLLDAVEEIQKEIPVVFPVHPRTRRQLGAFGLDDRVASMAGMKTLEPLSYVDFVGLLSQARLALTDSSGVQEETTALGIPCLTLRENTERPVTVTCGSNTVTGIRPAEIVAAARRSVAGGGKTGSVPELWDGRASERVAATLRRWWSQRGA